MIFVRRESGKNWHTASPRFGKHSKVCNFRRCVARGGRESSRPVFFSSSGSNYFSFSTLPYIRSTKATNWIPTVTYKRAPAISSTRIFILSYYLISPVTRINVPARVLANCRDTAHSPLINLSPRPVLRNATWNNFEITSTGIYIPFTITTVLCLLGFSKVSFVVYGFLGFLLFQHQL